MRRIPTREALGASRQHLIRQLLEQFERTFAGLQDSSALDAVTELLERLDDDNLRAYAYLRGIRAEDELEPDDDARAPGQPASSD